MKKILVLESVRFTTRPNSLPLSLELSLAEPECTSGLTAELAHRALEINPTQQKEQ
jgi:hypothetical protein